MAYFIGPQLNQQYKDYLRRVLADGGFYSRPNPANFQSDVDTILPLNPSLYTPANAGKVSKMYSMVPDTGAGDFTVSRNGTATYFDKDGLLKTAAANVPRFQFNTDGSFRGVLVEPAATNLLLRSEEFNNVYWEKVVSINIDINATNAPNNTLTAQRLRKTITGLQGLRKDLNIPTTGVYTTSFFAKKDTTDFVQYTNGSVPDLVINLTNGNIENQRSNTFTNVSVIPFPNGWYRINISRNINAVSSTAVFYIYPSDSTSLTFSSTSSTCSCFIWGAQFETGSVATSYIPTVDSTVTRPADVISLTGASALIGQSEGTIYIEGNITNYVDAAASFITVSDNSINNRLEIRKGSPNLIVVERNSSTQSGSTSITLSGQSNGIFKMAVAYQSGNTAFYVNGVQVGTNNTATFTMELLTHIYLGNNATGSARRLNDSIKVASIFPTRLSNAELQSLTTL